MKVKLFQQGGGFATFTPIMPAPVPANIPGQDMSGQNGNKNGNGGSKNGSILDDDTFNELLTKGGLVNDVNELVRSLEQIETSQSNPFLNHNNRNRSLQLISQINTLRENKNL
jgi:hypothetical protein